MKTIDQYLNQSERVINHAESMMDEEPEKAQKLLIEQISEHAKLLSE